MRNGNISGTYEGAVARHIQYSDRSILLVLPVPRDLTVLVT